MWLVMRQQKDQEGDVLLPFSAIIMLFVVYVNCVCVLMFQLTFLF